MARKFVMLLVIVCLGMFVFAAAGCGGDDDSTAADTELTETTTTEETEDTDTETTETEATTESEDTETTETSSSGDFATSENCQEFAEIGAKVSGALTGTSGDPNDIKEAFDELAAAAPDEIKADFETLSEYMTTVAEALGGVNPGEQPSPEALAKLSQIDATAATAASTNIAAWVTENCTGATP